MQQFTAPSGAEVIINPASWKDAKTLKNAIEREIAQSNTDSMLNNIMMVDSSPVVDGALWPCLIKCTRGGLKIVPETFDDVAARQDYYAIAEACIMENLRPLVESLFSRLSTLGLITKQADGNLKSASMTNSPSPESSSPKPDTSEATPPQS